jgi:hypothetical protein
MKTKSLHNYMENMTKVIKNNMVPITKKEFQSTQV